MRIVGPSWKVVRRFPAYDEGAGWGITHMRQVEGTSLLVTVAVGCAAPRAGRRGAGGVLTDWWGVGGCWGAAAEGVGA